jgi:hypothetical protein
MVIGGTADERVLLGGGRYSIWNAGIFLPSDVLSQIILDSLSLEGVGGWNSMESMIFPMILL